MCLCVFLCNYSLDMSSGFETISELATSNATAEEYLQLVRTNQTHRQLL